MTVEKLAHYDRLFQDLKKTEEYIRLLKRAESISFSMPSNSIAQLNPYEDKVPNSLEIDTKKAMITVANNYKLELLEEIEALD